MAAGLGLVLLAAACSDDPTATAGPDAPAPASGQADGGDTDHAEAPDDSENDSENDGEKAGENETGSEGDRTAAEAGPTPVEVTVGFAALRADGNRVLAGAGALGRVEPVDVAVPGEPVLVLPVTGGPDGAGVTVDTDGGPGGLWYVELADGRGLLVDPDADPGPRVVGDAIAVPPPTVDGFDDPLPDGIVVEAEGRAVALVGPTDRYPHGALGDRIEASAIEVLGPGPDDRLRFGPDEPSVIEGISSVVADATGDGTPEILVTHSNADEGAWLALWSLDGELVAESVSIGLGNRWRNQLAIAPVGPEGEIEVIDVRTPHLGGTVQYFRVEGDKLARVATRTGFTSHRIGSRNLDLGVVIDGDGDGRLDVVVPTDARDELGVLTRVDQASSETGAAVDIVASVALPGRLTTNIGIAPAPAPAPDQDADGDGGPEPGLVVAVGTDEEVVRFWLPPEAG